MTDANEKKTFNIRIPKETWYFLKKTAFEQETSMASIIVRTVEDYRKKFIILLLTPYYSSL